MKKSKWPELKNDNTISVLEIGLRQAERSLNIMKTGNRNATVMAQIVDQQEWVNAIKEAIEWRKKRGLE